MTEKSIQESIATSRAGGTSGAGAAAPPSIEGIDALDGAGFRAVMAPLFEGAPRFLDRLAAVRPFGSIDALFERARAIAKTMPIDDRIELIDAHPRLGAPPAEVSALSYEEQGYARGGANAKTEDLRIAAELERLNAAYEERFGFRYCVFVAGRSRAALLPEMAAALDADRDAEMTRALDAIVDIARDRYRSQTTGAAMSEGEP
jgi:2-oxo-4-hydroxy-4-carboxy--5-ureidoimidazoline (OHCU) decarboxylase